MKHPSLLRIGLMLVSALIVGLTSAANLSAQTVVPITPGSAIVGSISATEETVVYNFEGHVGDLVTLRVTALTPGMDPHIEFYGPNQELLFTDSRDSIALTHSSAVGTVSRLFSTGTYTIEVSGTAGDFVLMTDIQPATRTLPLPLDQPRTLAVPFANNPVIFAFNTNPSMPITLQVNSEPANLNTMVEVRDGAGKLTAFFWGSIDNHCVSLAPGDELFTTTLNTDPEADGNLTLTLSNQPCTVDTSTEGVVSTHRFSPIGIEGVCAASSFNNVNIRSGPGLQFPIIGLWRAGTPIQVVGRSEDGSWFVVQTPFVSGWMSARVVGVIGPCDDLSIVAPDAQLPIYSGILPSPQPNATQLMPARGTVGPTVTATVTPTPTSTPTSTITPTPTPTLTPTAIPTTAVPPTETTVPPTEVPPTAVPPTAVPPTAVPPTTVPPTTVPPTDVLVLPTVVLPTLSVVLPPVVPPKVVLPPTVP